MISLHTSTATDIKTWTLRWMYCKCLCANQNQWWAISQMTHHWLDHENLQSLPLLKPKIYGECIASVISFSESLDLLFLCNIYCCKISDEYSSCLDCLNLTWKLVKIPTNLNSTSGINPDLQFLYNQVDKKYVFSYFESVYCS